MLKGFKDFIFRGNVIELAVAVIIGGAFGAVVSSLVKDVFTPLIAAIAGKPEFDIKLGPVDLGAFLNALIAFLCVAVAVYFMIVVPMKKVQEATKKREAAAPAAPPEPSEEVKLLREIRDSLKK